MRLEPHSTLNVWASGVGIDVTAHRHAEGGLEHWLSHRGPDAEGRYWLTPYEPQHLLVFITSLLDAAGPWEFCWTVKRIGLWSDLDEGEGMRTVLESLGVPYGFDGAIRFDAAERSALTLLILTQISFGWCGYYDIWVVPSHGKHLLLTDDDDITPVFFAEGAVTRQVVQQMETAGFPLPQEPPSEMLPWPPWMGLAPEG